jgi:hypothetical protein
MNITLNELLTLLGRLDDAPGFDTARERFRRFLVEHVTDVNTVRPLVEECQRAVGEQHHRALQDLVVLLGRVLRFETTFGTYEALPGGVKVDGQWRSRGRLDVVLEIRTDQTPEPGFESLIRAVSAVAATAQTDTEGRIGLCVVARHYARRGRLEQAAALVKEADVRVVSVQSLLSLATKFNDDRLTHGEVVKLLRSGSALDFVIDLLDRRADAARPREVVQQAAVAAASASPIDPSPDPPMPSPSPTLVPTEPDFWVATLVPNNMATPEKLLASVVVQRRLLGIFHDGPLQDDGAPGDWVCFFVPGRGIVGHAQLESIVENAAAVIRNAERFSRVYQLCDVEIYDEPIVQALRAERPFVVPPADAMLPGPCLSAISKQDFVAMTVSRGVAPIVDVTAAEFPPGVVIERRSRSHV